MSKIIKQAKIFISAYACEPDLGSEIGVGWNWVLEMSLYFELWVLTRKSNKKTIEEWVSKNPNYKNINFIYFDLPNYLKFWKKGMRGVRTYYNIWQWCTNSIVKKVMIANDIKIFHHLTYGNALWSVSSYGQKQFFIWGPIGGLESIPNEFSKKYDLKSKIIEIIRRLVVNLLPINTSFKNRVINADLILCKTEITRKYISKYSQKSILFTDVATKKIKQTTEFNQSNNKITKYIAVGNLDSWRGFDLLIEAFGHAIRFNNNISLKILGKGTDYARLKKIIDNKDLSNHITMVGKVPMKEYYELMQEADVVTNPSLKEGAVTTAFDAMSLGKPLICIDTTGYTRYFSDNYAIVIPIESREKVIHSLTNAIVTLTQKDLRIKMGKSAQQAGEVFTWSNRGKEIHEEISKKFNESYK